MTENSQKLYCVTTINALGDAVEKAPWTGVFVTADLGQRNPDGTVPTSRHRGVDPVLLVPAEKMLHPGARISAHKNTGRDGHSFIDIATVAVVNLPEITVYWTSGGEETLNVKDVTRIDLNEPMKAWERELLEGVR